MRINTAFILTTTFCLLLTNLTIAPYAFAQEAQAQVQTPATTASVTSTNDFGPLIVPDGSNCAIPDTAPYATLNVPTAAPADSSTAAQAAASETANSSVPGLVPFDLSASRSYNLPSPNNNVLPAQSAESASTPSSTGQMPIASQAAAAATSDAVQAISQMKQNDMQTAQEWRKSAFEALTSNPNVQPMFGRTQAQMQGQSQSQSLSSSASSGSNSVGNAVGAQANTPGAQANTPGAANNGVFSNGMPGNTIMSSQPAQSQTLTAAAPQQQYGKTSQQRTGSNFNSGLMGLTRFASMFTMMGSGLMMGSMMRR